MTKKALKYAAVAIVALILLVGLGYVVGVFGVPSVENVENRFGGVNETTTAIESDITVNNPNPIDIAIGDLTIDYEIEMNDILMAHGSREGISIGSGSSTLELVTHMNNTNIPDWWVTHIDNDQQTEILIDIDLSHGLLGDRTVEVPQEETIETDILAGFNSTEPRPINADRPFIDDPVLYLNETTGWFGDDVTQENTPMEKEFTFYNPKDWPYTVTEIGYTIEMNDITVGEGETDRAHVIAGGETETIEADTEIRNQRLDEWWVSHLERNEVTDLYIDFYVVLDPDPSGLTDVEPIRIDSEEFDHQTTIETDIFGTKPETTDDSQNGDADAGDDGETDDSDEEEEETDDKTDDEESDTEEEETNDEETDEEDDGILP